MPADQEETARSFYIDTLGFREIPKPSELSNNGGLWLESGSVRLHLGVEEGFIAAKKAHPCLIVDDLTRISDTLKKNGMSVTEIESIGDMTRFFSPDCFGNRIEFTQEIFVNNPIEKRLEELGIVLPTPSAPAANYVPYTTTGTTLFISGQIPVLDGKLPYLGKVGDSVSLEDAVAAARLCGLNILSQVKSACGGDLSRVVRCVKLGGFVNCTPEFDKHPEVINGTSDLMVDVLGDKGKHARFAVGAPALPRNVAVEVDAIFEISI